MELWFSDYHTDKVKMSVKVEKQLFGEQTDFQRIDVFDSKEFGRFISSDGSIVFSEKDEFVYDEMIVHVPMAVHPNVRHVLVIGGGDGGVARELSYYKEIEEIDVVEPDEVFVEVCKKFSQTMQEVWMIRVCASFTQMVFVFFVQRMINMI